MKRLTLSLLALSLIAAPVFAMAPATEPSTAGTPAETVTASPAKPGLLRRLGGIVAIPLVKIKAATFATGRGIRTAAIVTKNAAVNYACNEGVKKVALGIWNHKFATSYTLATISAVAATYLLTKDLVRTGIISGLFIGTPAIAYGLKKAYTGIKTWNDKRKAAKPAVTEEAPAAEATPAA